MTNELKHYGILGMKWGVRNYQNPDGTLTEAGIKRYRNPGTRKEVIELVSNNLPSDISEKLDKLSKAKTELEEFEIDNKMSQNDGYKYRAISALYNSDIGYGYELAQRIFGFACDDLDDDRGVNGATLYLFDKGVSEKALELQNNVYRYGQDAVDSFVATHGSKNVGRDLPGLDNNGAASLAYDVLQKKGLGYYGYGLVSWAYSGLDDGVNDKRFNECKTIVEKLGIKNYNTVDKIMDAVMENDLGDKIFDDFTDSDFAAIKEYLDMH